MQIQRIKISNILGIESLEFSAGRFNQISGPNGKGKTSILEAIKSVFSRGHDATLLRKGAEQGEVVLVMDDETEVTRRVKQGASDTAVRQGGKKIARPSEYLSSLTDVLSVNPVDFLRATKKDRARVLLESMPIKADAAKLTAITGVSVDDTDTHALVVIDQVRKMVYDDRTGTNRAVKEKESTINQLRSTLPDVPEFQADEQETEKSLAHFASILESERVRIATKLSQLQAASAEKIAALQDQISAEKAAFSKIELAAAAQREKAVAQHAASTDPLKSTLAALRANRSALAKRDATLGTIKQMEEDAKALEADAKKQTDALAQLDQYAANLLSTLPIPGLTVTADGEIFRDGVPFDRLNTAQQVGIAVEVAKLRAGDLGVVCLDGLELLDSQSFAALQDSVEASGLQVFLTRVDDGGFNIQSQ